MWTQKLPCFPSKVKLLTCWPGGVEWHLIVMVREFTWEPPPFLCAMLCSAACGKVEGKCTWFPTRQGLRIVPLVLRWFHQCQCVPEEDSSSPHRNKLPSQVPCPLCSPQPHRASTLLSKLEASAFLLTYFIVLPFLT